MTGRVLYIDFETASDIDLRRTGVEVYAEGPNTRILCMAWAFDDGPIAGVMVPDKPLPPPLLPFPMLESEVFGHVRRGGIVVAHNAPFELALWRMQHERYPDIWPELRPEQTHCTMAMCRAMSFPGALDQAASALRLSYQKDKVGHALMLKLCKPRKPRKNEPKDILIWDHHTPENLARLLEYCKADVAPEREIWNRLPKLSDHERAYWLIDRRINNRGLPIDRDGVRIAAAASKAAKDALSDFFFFFMFLTLGRLQSINREAFALVKM